MQKRQKHLPHPLINTDCTEELYQRCWELFPERKHKIEKKVRDGIRGDGVDWPNGQY
jgi:hypothetical protein